MKSVCRFCNHPVLIKWGNRRRQCQKCKRTFRVTKAGRKKRKTTEMYILDRSTFRRISSKQKHSHPAIIKQLKKELKHLPEPIDFLKKIFLTVVTFWLSTANILPLKVRNIVSI